MIKGLIAVCIFFAGSSIQACPRIGRFIDFNCDQQLKIAITGDSLVYGTRDLERKNGGGYVARLAHRIAYGKIENLGVPGITTRNLYRSFRRLLVKTPPGETMLKSTMADIFIIDVGRNDFWTGQPPALTVRDIRRLVRYLKEELVRMNGVAPLILVATLAPTTRPYQKPFIDEVNRLLLSNPSSTLPAYLRFDKMNVAYVSYDGIHPASKGYDVLSKVAYMYLTHQAQSMCRQRRPDSDSDGLYDLFEKKRFFTKSTTLDTDGDGLGDGDEVLVFHSDPLLAPNS